VAAPLVPSDVVILSPLALRYEDARRALAEAASVDEIKQVRDMATAAQEYARQAKDRQLIDYATEIRERAERRAGEVLAEMKESGNRAGQGDRDGKGRTAQPLPKLADLGVTKTQSSRWQKKAAMPADKFEEYVIAAKNRAVASLDKAATQEDKRERRATREQDLAAKQLALPELKFNVIVEDFEWDFKVYSRDTGMDRHAANHYPVSDNAHTAEEIVERTHERFLCAADDCVLFMWATVPYLDVAIDVLRLRGFRYVSNYAWGNEKIGTGHWNRNRHEHLLIGIRGNIPAPAPGTQWDSLILAPVGEHSVKPECFLEMVEDYYPNLPKIELNRRGPPRDGWYAWGYEAEAAE
jgi:N6-adenosine-specific RNA methylase IME4